MIHRWLCVCLLAAVLSPASALGADPKRLIIIKADGLPGDVVERWERTTDPRTGASMLPWIQRVFFLHGTRLLNYYTRGISLSAPSWSMIDSGHHLVIHGNAEYDRVTLRVYDYLNFFPFYVNSARSRRADMPAVEVLDEAGIPLLIDQYDGGDRYQSMQLFQRGVKWRTLQHSLSNRVTTRSPRQLFDEWQTGFEFTEMIGEQTEREVIKRLRQPNFRYLDFFFGDYDHVTHLANDETSALDVLRKLDALVGRLWTAIEKSGHADDTVLVLTSDHGMNSDPAVFSQGFNLIRFFNSSIGGGHHVITNRHPLTEYKIRGLDPFVSEVTTASSESIYLAGQSQQYPTALLDLDGNERAAVHLRNSDLNRLQQLLLRATTSPTSSPERAAAENEFWTLVARWRPRWQQELGELNEELAALGRAITRQQATVAAQPKKFTAAERDRDLDEPPKRERAALDQWQQDERGYREYARWLERMLALDRSVASVAQQRIDALVPPRLIGPPNTIHDLQCYAAGPSTRIDYFTLLTAQRVRNNVQNGVGAQPIDMVAVRVDPAGAESLHGKLGAFDYAVFVQGGEGRQALILTREESPRSVHIRYVPVANLRQEADGAIAFDAQPWTPGLPLRVFEDPNLNVSGERAAWLSEWHTDEEWLRATHRTAYSIGVIGLAEHFRPVELGAAGKLWQVDSPDAALLKRFELRRLHNAEADLLLLASDHWNFNVRGFNPGGNHGGFFRVSTDATLMLAGPGIPQGMAMEQPYDTLSFFPTLLRITGLATSVQVDSWPGRVIRELLP